MRRPANTLEARLQPRTRAVHCGLMPRMPANKAVIVVVENCDIPVGKTNPMPLIFTALTKMVMPGNVPQ